ncbi:winged helix-turn-helix domain-containing protein [Allokutzneria sp. A3M-2-11 16]|uniref:BTAD domain-containing putative transcriptional regulator n=1 Tax=Allokutzneria sp. A3M-2-11 16 TaxID=2962043 RepID=UPI0020B89BAB|nr:BTAD domain-containing putative transcriptional regulator [Allokutzneria sp. A3M-2-11 16]MCP3803894.1 winged helix-turn-helix domain-containing protein [Allokutzneria sp. A3M-2-11 16]
MRFGVLGPLEVWTADGTPVVVPESKVRALLADLLLHEGEFVSADRLIDDLWGERLPVNPAKTLQTRVWQLRRALGDARELVVSRPSGYALRVEPGMVDAGRFEALRGRARAVDDPGAKVKLLTEALELWRGPAFAEFQDAEFARHAVERLSENRLAALEDRAEAWLAADGHDAVDLLGELGELVDRHPLRERLRAVHMRALYGAGRQGEALEGYDRLRHRLAEELGLDPGPDLVALRQAILERDPGLSAEPPTNLPAPLTALIGRVAAVAELRALLGDSRLVTLTGPGGVGKTRLAVETARQLTKAFPDGVWLVELSGADRGVADLVSTVVGLREDTPGPGLEQRLASMLRTKRLLLVLDNCEHVVEAVAELAERLLRAAPGVRVLATSRQPLAAEGEAVWPVPPLDPPEAAQLFAARAAPGFVLDEGDAEAVATICRRLDGIPLALELAATRLRALGVRELAARIDDRFALLAEGRRTAPSRQRTLRAVIDWSWELLTETEQTVLRRLAVHADGCTLDAAEAVSGGTLDVLARLVDRSLVVMIETADGPRYRLLESVAAYCLERLDEAGETEELRARHRHYYTEFAEQAEPHLRGRDQRQWLRRLDAESANFHRALDGDSALRLANALGWYWFLRGRLGEARRALDAALDLGGPAPVRAKAEVWRAGFALLIRDAADPDSVEPGPALLDAVEDRAQGEWFLRFTQKGFGARASGERLLADLRAAGDQWGIAAALSTEAFALAATDLAQARRIGAESLALFEELGDRWGQVKAGQVLSQLAEVAGDYDTAVRLRREGLRNAEELGLWTEAAHELAGLGRSALLAGDYPEAEKFHTRSMHMAEEQSYRWGVQHAEIGLALGARRQGRFAEAERHLLNWLDWCRRWGGAHGLAFILAELGFTAEQRGDAATAFARHLDSYATARSTGDPRAVALALEGLAGAHALSGDFPHAARMLGAASALRESAGAPLPPAESADIDRISTVIRRAVGEPAFAEAFRLEGEFDPDYIVRVGQGLE